MEKAEGNIVEQYAGDFKGYDIELSMAGEAIIAIAEQASQEKTGARGLTTVLERIFRDYKFELPSTGIKSLEIDAEAVENPQKALELFLEKNEPVRRVAMDKDIDYFVDSFYKEHELKLTINKAAREVIISKCLNDNITVNRWVGLNFHDFEYALNLISRNTGKKSFNVTKKLVENTEAELSSRIAASFGK
jgi:hypothetical protein